MDPDDPRKPHPRTERVYIGGNNHHIEIRETTSKGKWSGRIVPTLDAARRVRVRKLDAVNRADTDAGTFIMSLAEGDMIYARAWDAKAKRPVGQPDYFVVCKLDKPQRVHFAPHWDARKASEQDRWSATPDNLRQCGPEPGTPPIKVRVGPLGDLTHLTRD
jgi:hypothetical protein